MKISTKFNLFVGCFFFFVFLAVFYSYCGGLTICYSFPFLNSIRGGPVSRAKVMMTSYIIHEKGEPRDDASNTIYFYSKVNDNSHQKKEKTRKPGNDNTRRKKTGSSSVNPPSVITGKTALDILRKSNTSLEEANRTLFREEKVDKQVDREDLIKAKLLPTQSTPIFKNRGGLRLKHKPPRIYPIRKPPRKLRKKLRKNRFNRLSKQDSVDRAPEKKLERVEVEMRMRGFGPSNESHSSKTYLHKNSKNRIKDLKNMSLTQTEESKDSTNEGVSPLDVLKYRNEAITYTKRHRSETKRRSAKFALKSTSYLKMKNSTLDFENKEKINNKTAEKETFILEKGSLRGKEKQNRVILNQNYTEFNQTKISESKSELFSKEDRAGSHDDRSVTSTATMKMKRKKKNVEEMNEGSGTSLSTGELIRSIKNINDKNLRYALQSALDKDEQQLKINVSRVKTTLERSYHPFNLTKVLEELVKTAEFDQGEKFPRLKDEILLKRRDSWDKPLVRVKRLGRIKRRNKQSERTLVRVKRINEDEDEEP